MLIKSIAFCRTDRLWPIQRPGGTVYYEKFFRAPSRRRRPEGLALLAPGVVRRPSSGLVVALLFAPLSAAASGRYAIASLVFGFTGRFPRRPARFMEWARNAGLLRVTGIAYQFRHDTYQQWLSEGGGNQDVTVRSDPPAEARSG